MAYLSNFSILTYVLVSQRTFLVRLFCAPSPAAPGAIPICTSLATPLLRQLNCSPVQVWLRWHCSRWCLTSRAGWSRSSSVNQSTTTRPSSSTCWNARTSETATPINWSTSIHRAALYLLAKRNSSLPLSEIKGQV